MLLFADWLLENQHLPQILAGSPNAVEVFVGERDAPCEPLDRIVAELDLSVPSERGDILALYLSPQHLRHLRSGGRSSGAVGVNLISKPVLLDPDSELPKLALTSKARTLAFLHGLLRKAEVDPGSVIRRETWSAAAFGCVREILTRATDRLIVRSSAVSEDSFESSHAGAYESVLDVEPTAEALSDAIERVFGSYGHSHPLDEVLVQGQLRDVACSGVCSTRVIGKNAPYYVISYDEHSGRTDTVTSGSTNEIKTQYVLRWANLAAVRIPETVKQVLAAVQEIEATVDSDALDIEFIVDRAERVHIVQVRPLVGRYQGDPNEAVLERVRQSVELFRAHAGTDDNIALGTRTLFGVMPDANPAELIGIKPKPLAFTLYRHLITDDVVGNQRHEYGYRDIRPRRHMLKMGGSPFIDVRTSFNSFTPRDLDGATTRRLIDLYLERLATNPSLHDKVEFEVVVSCWFPGVDTWLGQRYGHALSSEEISRIVKASAAIFKGAVNRVEGDSSDVEAYGHLFDAVTQSSLSPLHKAHRLIEICHDFGCKPFAHLARSAFVAVSVLKGFVRESILSQAEYDTYLRSVESVSTTMARDAFATRSGLLSFAQFNDRYGHLRPGTYDITSEAYFEDPHKYLDPIVDASTEVVKPVLQLSSQTLFEIEHRFAQDGIALSFAEFDRFARQAIHGREHGKFTYTKFLSHALDQLIRWGHEIGLSRDDLAFLEVGDLHGIVSGTLPVASIKSMLRERRGLYEIDTLIELPELIEREEDFYAFHKTPGQPNYITGNSIAARLAFVSQQAPISERELLDCVAVIEGADPGYDWLFGCGISGLITKYGGANSHMAIRCAELGIPAAIGVGDVVYRSAETARLVRMDCINKRLEFSN